MSHFRVFQTSHNPLKIGGKTLSLSITAKKCTVVACQRMLQAAVDLTSRRCVFLNFCKGPWGCNAAILVRNQTFSNLHANVEVWKKNKQFQFIIFIPENFGPPKIGIKIGIKLSSRNSNLFQFLFQFLKMDPKTKIWTRLLGGKLTPAGGKTKNCPKKTEN